MLKVNCDEEGITNAAAIINKGGIAVFPTDTVYGIGCNAYNKKAVEEIYRIKSRDRSKPFPILTDSLKSAEKIAVFDEYSKNIARHFWPGPLTILLKLTDQSLQKSLNLKDKIALRVPNHDCTLKLLKKCNFLVGTSANTSGQKSFVNPDECIKNLKNYDVFVDGGEIDSDSESTIIEIIGKRIKVIRKGALSKEEIMVK